MFHVKHLTAAQGMFHVKHLTTDSAFDSAAPPRHRSGVMSRGLYIAGTAGNVGKTVVARSLTAALTRRGLRVAVMKPVETGCSLQAHAAALDEEEVASLQRLEAAAGPLPANLGARTPRASLRPQDALALLQAADLDQSQLEAVNPYRFAPELEPAVAARASESAIELEVILEHHRALRSAAQLTVVEGTSGLLAPLTPERSMLDLVAALELAVVLVSPSTYGAINDCLLNIRLLEAEGVPLAGVVLNRLAAATPGPEEAANPYQIERCSRGVVLGVLPHFSAAQLADLDYLGQRFTVHIDLERILASSGATET
jgi:dethiobiotin synthetase